ncbi:MAG: YggS family pyridoxal phosphate-dependent enzyme [Candidatus Omnitrophica bacterium]|nr:YggS family pyridoxal phosphate-dependent enzyme [Candidatus Omnitrophota bacterium]
MPRMIADNIKSVTQRIAKCCEKTGRPAGSVQLVCVTKEASVSQMLEAARAGIKIFGENRVQDAARKHAAIGNRAEWHLIGHLQTNKARDAVGIFSLIHSVDSVRLADAIDKEAGRIGKRQDILVQVNISGEKSKFGIPPESAAGVLKEIVACPNISIRGLMTIAPEADDPEEVRPYFAGLRQILEKVNVELGTNYSMLSMGMSNDFEVAVEEGATLVRIGRAIFR